MNLNSTQSMKVTYKQLDRALLSLGFVRLKSREYRIYREEEHDAVIALPLMRASVLVGDPHLIAVRNTVTGRGVATWETLYSELMTTRQGSSESVPQPNKPAHPLQTQAHSQLDVPSGKADMKRQALRRKALQDQRRRFREAETL